MAWTLATVGQALGAAVPAALAATPAAGFSIDSRTVRAGEVFIALKGPRFDGHDFVAQALARGAALAVVSEARRASYGAEFEGALLAVPDTFRALQQLGLFARRQWGRTLIGVTGSTGKTTTKDLLAALLATRHRVLASEGNLNNEFGVPLTLLRLEAAHELAVLELAMAHKGELAKLCEVAEANVGLVTNVAPVHLEFFSSLEEIAQAKRELIHGLRPPATAVLNADDPRVLRFREGFSGRVVLFGVDEPADVRAETLDDRGLAGCRFDLVAGGDRRRVALRLPGRQHVSNAVAAFAAADLFGVSLDDADKVFAAFEPRELRGRPIHFAEGFTIVNDAYNSNPLALAAMAQALSRTPGARRRLLVAGEMKELGASSPELHREAGAQTARLGNIDYIAGVTGDARHLCEGARATGMAADTAPFFESKEAAADWLCGILQPGDWVVLKASRGVALETVLEAVAARFAPAAAREKS